MTEETDMTAAPMCTQKQLRLWEEEAPKEHDEAAASLLYWYLEQDEMGSWVRYDADKETLVHAGIGDCMPRNEIGTGKIANWRPWNKTLCTQHSPYFRWFWAGRTNACLNLVDKHLFEGRGHDIAFTSCPEPDSGRLEGSLPPSTSISRRNLAVAVAVAAKRLLEECGLETSDRALFMMPTGISQMVYLLAAMRFGLLYVCTTVDQPDAALEYRMNDFKPSSIITQSGTVIHGGKEIDCLDRAQNLSHGRCKLIAVDPVTTLQVHDWATDLGDRDLSRQLAAISPVASLVSDHALFVSYTSGSTGKPKGMVHTHGGYVYGIARTMEAVFEARAGVDSILTLGTTAWITGQSYMLVGPLVSGVRSVLLEGAPVYPRVLRFADVLRSERCTIFKSGSAMMRQVQSDDALASELSQAAFPDLRMGTFCAEPVTEAVHQFACRVLTPNFINSYWATEHGGIVFTRRIDPPRILLQPDTKVFPLPWIKAAVRKGDHDDEGVTAASTTTATDTRNVILGDILINKPYPYLARTIFGDAENAKSDGWKGDIERFGQAYFTKDGCFVQGDAVQFHVDDSSYTFHGRTDEVINVSGNRVGTEEIEAAVWAAAHGSIQAAVVGGPDHVKGLTPVAWVIPANGVENPEETVAQLVPLVRREAQKRIGSFAAPDHVLSVTQLPLTQTGKTSRKLLQLLLDNKEASPDALKNPGCLPELRAAAERWRAVGMAAVKPHTMQDAWERFRVHEHVIQGRAIFPAAGWLCELPQLFGVHRLTKLMLLRPLESAEEAVTLKKQGRSITVLDGGEPLLRASLEKDSTVTQISTDLRGPEEEDLDTRSGNAHYRRCDTLQLCYAGSYRLVERVEWGDFTFRAQLADGAHLAAVLDAGLQVVCAYNRLDTFIPVMVDAFELAPTCGFGPHQGCQVLGRIISLQDDRIKADITYYDNSEDAPFAVVRGVVLSRIASRRPRDQQQHQQADTSQQQGHSTRPGTLKLQVPTTKEGLQEMLLELIQSITGSQVDPAASLFENSIQSLRVGELRQKIEGVLGKSPSMQQLVSASSLEALANDVQALLAAKSDTAGNLGRPFPHVNYDEINRIIKDELAPKSLREGLKHIDQLPYVIYYIMRKGLFTYLRLQYRDGLFAFMRNPPKHLDLGMEVVVPGPSVNFHQTDFNAHFTVREIVKDSERGYYNLVHRNGIAHLEHYFGVMLFCANLESSFTKELPVNQPYEMRCRVSAVQGPLVSAEIAFHDALGERCFVVVWKLLLVIDAKKRQMFDFELGRVTDAVAPEKEEALHAIEAAKTQPRGILQRLWTAISVGELVYLFCAVLVGLLAMRWA